MTWVGIVTALAAEARTVAGKTVTPGQPEMLSEQTLIALSGLGPARAHAASQALLEAGAQALLSWGTAAALEDRLDAGTLLLPTTVIAESGARLQVDRLWHAAVYDAMSRDHAPLTAPLLESPSVVATVRDKRRLREQGRGIAVDMESAAIGRAARDAGVPFMVVRAVVDTAKASIPQSVLAGTDCYGRLRLADFLLALIRHPAAWPQLPRLARDFQRARKTLVRTAIQASSGLGLLPPAHAAAQGGRHPHPIDPPPH